VGSFRNGLAPAPGIVRGQLDVGADRGEDRGERNNHPLPGRGINFEIAEGCSGIRSLMAMTTLTALYAHFTQTVLWKKLTLFGSSIIFAVVGNIGRIFTVILVAKFYDPEFASGLYHDYSASSSSQLRWQRW
jgi:exosortase/archaeosortase family protein